MNPPPPAPFLDEKKSLACVHCGLCLGACPTYLETGNENLSPRGRIYLMRALQEGRLTLDPDVVSHLDLCLGCRACESACPSGVEYGALLEPTREHVEKHHKRSWFQRVLRKIAIERVFPFPNRLKLALLPARALNALNLGPFLPKILRDALALVPESSPGQPLPPITHSSQSKKLGQVGFITGCVMSVLFRRTNQRSVQLLAQAGYDVAVPAHQMCCGALHAHGGNLEAARRAARANIAAFEHLDLKAIIINAAGCGSTLKEYGHLLSHDPAWAARAEAFSARVKDLSECLPQTQTPPARGLERPIPKVTYHDACHLAHAQRITQPPRALIKNLAGSSYVELPEADVCCGSAGTYNLTEPAMAARLQRRKIQNILRTGAEIVVTTNPGCLLQIRAGLREAGAGHIQVLHIADFLTSFQGDRLS